MNVIKQIQILTLIIVLLGSTEMSAQKCLGARMGVTISNFSNPNELGLERTHSKLDYTMGYFVEVELNKKRGAQESNVVFQTGMTFERRGLISNGFDEELGVDTDLDFTMKYFSFPLVLKTGVGDSDILNFMVGPEFSLLYLATNERKYTTFDEEKEESIDRTSLTGVTPQFKSVDVSITAGASLDIPVGKRFRIPVDVRIGKSLMDTRRRPSRFSDSASHILFKFNTGIVLYY